MPKNSITTAEQLVEDLFTNTKGRIGNRMEVWRDAPPRACVAVYDRHEVLAKVNELVESVRLGFGIKTTNDLSQNDCAHVNLKPVSNWLDAYVSRCVDCNEVRCNSEWVKES